jgi:putative CocE/NonD family hydrolase
MHRTAPAALLLISLWVPAYAAGPDKARLPMGSQIGDYVGEDVMIPMRDGVNLHAEVWRPRGFRGKLPILMQRSPYGFDLATVTHSFDAEYKELAQEGFIFVLEDIRGRFGSGGNFVMLRPKAVAADGVDESTDAYDTIKWLIESIPGSNGNVGVFGVSYLGWTTAMSMVNPHPALKAVSIQASPEDMFLGDDFHHNGAFRLDYGWEYAAAMETSAGTVNTFDFKKDDPYSWFLKQDDLATLDRRALGRPLSNWQDFVEHPNYDQFWRSGVTSARIHSKVTIPNLIVAGWWDQEDFYGPLKIYQAQERDDSQHHNFLVIGPWNHGGWTREHADHYGPFELGSDTAAYFRAKVETPWFKYWLKNSGVLDQPEALIFETGSNQWRSYAAWPPIEGTSRRKLYFHANGKLSFDPPNSPLDAEPNRFVSDPANPVPYRERPISAMAAENSTWESWLADDQAPFAKRADVLSWQTDVLPGDVTIRGNVIAELFASTTGTDADWIVKLIDVFPADEATPPKLRGRQLIIADEVFRSRFRSSFEHPKPLVPNKVLAYSIDLHTASHVFKKGHRIAVQVQSSWFPLIDQNPQTFRPNILKMSRARFKIQTHSIFHTVRYPSAILVEVAATTP